MNRWKWRSETHSTASPWRERATLVVSPHFDDVILSAFSAFAPASDYAPCAVLTVFTAAPDIALRTAWDASCGLADSSVAMATRQAEDAAAFAGLGVERLEGGLLETQYRQGRPLDLDRVALIAKVTDWVERTNGSVLLPVGAGGPRTVVHKVRWRIPHSRLGLGGGSIPHVDHLWVGETLTDGLPRHVPIGFYEEQPYSWIGPGDARIAQLCHAGRAVRPVVTLVDRTEKARRIECYKSQLGGVFAPWVRDVRSVIRPTERIWMPVVGTP